MADEQETEDTPGDGDDVIWTDAVDDNGHADSWAPLGGQSSIEDMARTLSTFGMRLDALVTSTTGYRAAITDRLVEYADTVNKLVKHQSADLEEHRLANQRLLAELQRGISTSDETVSRLGDRLDELLRADEDDTSRQILSEVRSVLEAQERLGQFLTEALDQFGDRVTERLDAGQTGNVAQLDSLVATLDVVQRSERALESNLSEVGAELRGIRETVVDLASGEVVAALWDEVRALRDGLSGDGGASFLAGATVPAETSQLTDAVRDLLDAAEVVPPEESALLTGLAADLAELRADLRDGLLVEPDATLDEALTSIRSGVEGLDERLTGLDDVAAQIAAVRDSLHQGVAARPTAELSDALAAIRAGVDSLAGRLDDMSSEADGFRWPVGSLQSDPTELDARVADEMQRLADELRAARTEVSAISERLDEGLVIDAPSDSEVVDRVSAMRREVTAELEAVRQILADAVDRPAAGDEVEMVVDLDPVVALVDELRSEIRSIPTSEAQVSSPGRDEGALDELRAEVRALAGMPESLVESLRAELVALRRRIKVRSEADVLTDDQLDRIAEAVADRLA